MFEGIKHSRSRLTALEVVGIAAIIVSLVSNLLKSLPLLADSFFSSTVSLRIACVLAGVGAILLVLGGPPKKLTVWGWIFYEFAFLGAFFYALICYSYTLAIWQYFKVFAWTAVFWAAVVLIARSFYNVWNLPDY
jgi:hypothetical protein